MGQHRVAAVVEVGDNQVAPEAVHTPVGPQVVPKLAMAEQLALVGRRSSPVEEAGASQAVVALELPAVVVQPDSCPETGAAAGAPGKGWQVAAERRGPAVAWGCRPSVRIVCDRSGFGGLQAKLHRHDNADGAGFTQRSDTG